MPDIPMPQDLGIYLSDLERRLRIIETAPRLQNSAFPWVSDFIETEESTTSTINTDLATVGPEVTVQIGQTSRVEITMAATIVTPPSVSAAGVLMVDGAYPNIPPFSLAPLFLRNENVGTISAACSATRSWTSSVWLAPGAHTFRMRYRVAVGPGTVYFSNRYLAIRTY